ncbi:MAG: hypothetical protein ACM3TU_03015 [Bacillota bacterium]
MAPLPKRTEHTTWKNPEPYTDIHAVLQLLDEQSKTYEPFHLDQCRREGCEWEITVPWYTHGDSGGDRSGHDYYQIDPALAEQLVKDGLVIKRSIPHMGYTETREHEFVISRRGKVMLKTYLDEMREKAEALLVPGVHTDLTGEPASQGYDREHWRYGDLYFMFKLPTGGSCKVYPEQGKLVLPGSEDAQAA